MTLIEGLRLLLVRASCTGYDKSKAAAGMTCTEESVVDKINFHNFYFQFEAHIIHLSHGHWKVGIFLHNSSM